MTAENEATPSELSPFDLWMTAEREAVCTERGCYGWDSGHDDECMLAAWNKAQELPETELLRLAGPVCPHDQKRAVEHTFLLMKFGEDDHPSWPDGAEWARGKSL